MQTEDMILVSIDDHVIEPRDMFERHVPDKYKDDAPKVVTNDKGVEQWLFQGAAAGVMGLNAVVTWPKEDWGMDPDELRRDAPRRVRRARAHPRHEPQRHPLLDVLPDVRRVSAPARSVRADDKDLSLLMLQAYNDWHIDEWARRTPAGSSRSRCVPRGIRNAMVAEIRRVSAKGCPAMTFPELPHIEGLPSYHDLDYWGPVFEALSDEQVVMCLHIGQGFAAISTAPDAPIDNMIILATQVSAFAAQDLLWGPAFRTYPDLKVRVVRSRHRLDPVLPRSLRPSLREPAVAGSRLRRQDAERHLPRPLARVLRHRPDRAQGASRHRHGHHRLGVRLPALRLDLARRARDGDARDEWAPAPTTTRSTRSRGRTPAHFFGSIRSRDTPKQATVGALRAKSPDVDITIRSRAEWARLYEQKQQLAKA